MAIKIKKQTKFECPLCGGLALYSELKTLWGRARRGRQGGLEPETVGPMPCCGKALTMEQMKTLWGKATVAQRTVHAAGPGRPKASERCPCGEYTKERAAKRNHQCIAKPARRRKAKAK